MKKESKRLVPWMVSALAIGGSLTGTVVYFQHKQQAKNTSTSESVPGTDITIDETATLKLEEISNSIDQDSHEVRTFSYKISPKDDASFPECKADLYWSDSNVTDIQVSDYLKVSIDLKAFTVTLTCLQALPHQATLKVWSADDPHVCAIVLIDYKKKFNGWKEEKDIADEVFAKPDKVNKGFNLSKKEGSDEDITISVYRLKELFNDFERYIQPYDNFSKDHNYSSEITATYKFGTGEAYFCALDTNLEIIGNDSKGTDIKQLFPHSFTKGEKEGFTSSDLIDCLKKYSNNLEKKLLDQDESVVYLGAEVPMEVECKATLPNVENITYTGNVLFYANKKDFHLYTPISSIDIDTGNVVF